MIKLPPHGPHQRIGLFGGSFNPAHAGHRQVALFALKHLKLDWIWWLVSPQNPLKNPNETSDYAKRLALTRQLAHHPRFIVSDLEKQIGSKYTAQTIKALKKFSHAHFVWIMGADSFASFHHWHDWVGITKRMPFAVLARPGYSIKALDSKAAIRFRDRRLARARPVALATKKAPRWVFISMPLRKESSTAIRATRKIV